MTGPIKLYLNNFHIRWILAAGLALNIALFLFLFFFIEQSNVPIVLHYNVDLGVDYLSEVKSVFILPAVGLIIFLFNGVLALRLWDKNRILSYFLTAVIAVSQVFLFLAGIALYLINA